MVMSGQLYASAILPLGKNPRSHWLGEWLGCGVIMNVLEKRKTRDTCQDSRPRLSCPCLVSILIMLSQVPLCGVFTVCSCSSVQFVNSWHTRCSSWPTGVDCYIKHSLFIKWPLPMLLSSFSFYVLCCQEEPCCGLYLLKETEFHIV
jgi:hypothetical protein